MAAAEEVSSTPTPRFLAFSQRVSNELNIVSIDHCYAKPWSSHPDASNACPLHMLFMDKFPRSTALDKQRTTDVVVDVEAEDNTISPMYDVGKARAMMSDCERHATLLRPDYAENKDDWEDHIAAVRTGWSVLQNRLFAKVTRVLQADRLARLSIQGTKNEPIQRRLQIDKAAKRVRFCFANVGWDMTLILWLHNLFLEHLRGQLLTSYLEVLQTLKAKIPTMIDRLIQGTTSKTGGFTAESLNGLLKRSWDPVLMSINQQKLKKLPDSPLLLIISSAPSSAPNPVAIKRHKFWQHQLSAMGKVISVVPINNSTSLSIANCVENMIATTRSKILEMKGQFPGRPIILIGWHVGALVATHVALMEVVHGVVCLGFPTMGVCGNRGEIDDQIYNCKTPTLFVVGQHASTCSLDTLEDIREKLRVETGLLLVGGADDQLRMSRAKKRSCGVTQAMVDRCIMDEMFEFLSNVLSQIVVQPESIEEVDVIKKPRKRKQKDISTTAASQTGTLLKQPTVKNVKAMKLANTGTVAFTGPGSVPGGPKLGKRGPTKKRTPKSTEKSVPGRKPALHLSFPVSDTQSSAISKASEAAAIASAPELSNLLQSIKTTDQSKLSQSTSSSFSTAGRSVLTSSTTIATTTALTLSKFLASSAFLRTGLGKLPDDLGSSGMKSKSEAGNEQSSTEQSQLLDDPLKQQPQILIRTGVSSAPFSIPLTFTVDNKVLKSAPVMRLTSTGTSTPHIQHLLTSVSGSVVPSAAAASSAATTTHTLSSTLLQTAAAAHSSAGGLSPRTFGLVSPSHFVTPTLMSMNNAGPAISTGALSPGASVINMGTDTVFMKENPPSVTSVPGTVSIDLGQIATGASTSAMKLSSAPKISLIPTMKQIPISGSSERLLLTTPLTGTQPSIATLSSLSLSQQSSFGTKPCLVSSTATQQKSTDHTHSDSIRTLSTALSTSPLKTIAGMSSSQLLSTLSTSAGLITLKMPVTQVNTSTTSAESKDETDGQHKTSDLALAQLRGKINLQGHSVGYSSLTGSNISKISKAGDPLVSTLHSGSLGVSKPFSPSSSLLVTPGSKLGTGQIVLHCRGNPGLSTLSQPSTGKPGSPKLIMATTSETLGQVTSLLESSPITMGDHRKPQTSSSGVSSSIIKPSSKTPPSPSAASSPLSTSSSSSSVSSQGHSGGTKSSKTTISSYTATPKPVLPTIASTRTRRIKTPKQYDL